MKEFSSTSAEVVDLDFYRKFGRILLIEPQDIASFLQYNFEKYTKMLTSGPTHPLKG